MGLLGCNSPQQPQETNSSPQRTYEEVCANIPSIRASLKDDEAVPTRIAAFLEQELTDSIFPHWYGTPWNYSGTTTIPHTDSIACGYFVTTTLQHMHVNLDRVALAREPASSIIYSLCEESSIETFGNNDLDALEQYLHQHEDGLWILGLDNHVGFVEKTEGQLFVIHSSPVNGVERAPLRQPGIIRRSKLFMVGKLFEDKSFLTSWLNGWKIPLERS